MSDEVILVQDLIHEIRGKKERFALYKTFSSGGTVSLMDGIDRDMPDYHDLLTIACSFARRGHHVKILYPTHYKDPIYREVFGELIGTVYYRKCPDLLIDGMFYEYESYERPFRSGKVSHMIKRGAQQANRIIIDNNKGASDRFILNMIVKRLNDKMFRGEILELYVYEKGDGYNRHFWLVTLTFLVGGKVTFSSFHR